MSPPCDFPLTSKELIFLCFSSGNPASWWGRGWRWWRSFPPAVPAAAYGGNEAAAEWRATFRTRHLHFLRRRVPACHWWRGQKHASTGAHFRARRARLPGHGGKPDLSGSAIPRGEQHLPKAYINTTVANVIMCSVGIRTSTNMLTGNCIFS